MPCLLSLPSRVSWRGRRFCRGMVFLAAAAAVVTGSLPGAAGEAAEFVLALQTIVAREVKPNGPAVVTVGSIRAGTTLTSSATAATCR